ncbi:hypothetical protein ST47_g4230 [Ascochyta rabiei]|uniref:Uncharacterized protein n=1 Tax=Didymella rabiei TaxID=5454 RepID=A0A163FRC5_DIDRA|nr:hypothetical protein ST47_g4230 [Ascochyta rabiei]
MPQSRPSNATTTNPSGTSSAENNAAPVPRQSTYQEEATLLEQALGAGPARGLPHDVDLVPDEAPEEHPERAREPQAVINAHIRE